jgi:hypothetical protein
MAFQERLHGFNEGQPIVLDGDDERQRIDLSCPDVVGREAHHGCRHCRRLGEARHGDRAHLVVVQLATMDFTGVVPFLLALIAVAERAVLVAAVSAIANAAAVIALCSSILIAAGNRMNEIH